MVVHFATHVFGHVHVGQTVQGKDVALLPVLVDLGESQFCCTLCHCIFTWALLPTVLLHWRGTDVHAPQRQQHCQQHTVLHGKGLRMTDCSKCTHTSHAGCWERCSEGGEDDLLYSQTVCTGLSVVPGKYNHCPPTLTHTSLRTLHWLCYLPTGQLLVRVTQWILSAWR